MPVTRADVQRALRQALYRAETAGLVPALLLAVVRAVETNSSLVGSLLMGAEETCPALSAALIL